MIDLIFIVDDDGIAATVMAAIIPTMVVIVIVTINADRHYRKGGKIGRIESVIIRRNIGHIGGGIHILHDGR